MFCRHIAFMAIAAAVAVASCGAAGLGANPATAPFVGERDALDSVMTEDEQWEAGVDVLTREQRDALMKVLLKAFKAGAAQQFIVMSSYGSFTAGLVEFTGSRFIFDLNPIEMQRLKRAQSTLEWLPESRLALFPYQVTWLRR